MNRPIETIEAGIYRRLDAMRGDIIKLTQDMVAFKSVNPRFMADPENSQESEVQDYIESKLRALGLEITRWEAEARRPNLVARRRGSGGGRSLAFNGHIDVVPIGDLDGWNYDPWGSDIADGKLYGRGTVDMKAGLAAFIAATEAIIKSDIKLKGDLQLHIVVDEEAGGFAGTRDVIKRGYRADGIVVAEPTSGYIDAAEGGLTWLRVTIRGRAAHAGWRFAQIYPQAQPDAENAEGVNAIEKGVKFVAAVREFEREWALGRHHPLMPPGITTINPGVMVGGVGLGADGLPQITSNPAMIPDVCVIDFDFKYLPTETFQGARDEFEDFVAAFARADPWLRDHPPSLQWHLSNIDFPPFSTAPDHPLIEAVRDTHQQLGIETVLTGKRAVTDAAFYAGAGMTPIILGPAGAGLHGDNEFVELDSLIETAKVFVGLILRWCGISEWMNIPDYLRSQLARYLADLERLVAIDSGTYDKDGCNRVNDWLEQRLGSLGFGIERYPQADTGDHLRARLRSQGSAKILLLCHSDTVYPTGTAARRPLKQAGDRLLGAGVCDMKAGLLAGLYALEALNATGFEDFASLTLLCVADEEVDERSSIPLMRETMTGADAALTLEAARENGDIVTARKGNVVLRVEAHGRGAHAGVEPEKGRNAISGLLRRLLQVEALAQPASDLTLNIGSISGGSMPNVVPDYASASIDIRAFEQRDLERAVAAIEGIFAAPATDDIRFCVEHRLASPPMPRSDAVARLEDLAIRAAAGLGFALRGCSTGGGADSAFAAQAGLAVLDGLGPIGGLDHGPDEYILKSSIVPRTALLAELIKLICKSRAV